MHRELHRLEPGDDLLCSCISNSKDQDAFLFWDKQIRAGFVKTLTGKKVNMHRKRKEREEMGNNTDEALEKEKKKMDKP